MSVAEVLSVCVALAVPLIAAVLAWTLNMRGKLQWEKQQHKEDRYRRILKVISGFYGGGGTLDDTTFDTFHEEWRLAWIYCPDTVIRTGNAFLATLIEMSEANHQLDASTGQDERIKLEKQIIAHNQAASTALSHFMLAIRRDVQPKTRLTGQDYGPNG